MTTNLSIVTDAEQAYPGSVDAEVFDSYKIYPIRFMTGTGSFFEARHLAVTEDGGTAYPFAMEVLSRYWKMTSCAEHHNES